MKLPEMKKKETKFKSIVNKLAIKEWLVYANRNENILFTKGTSQIPGKNKHLPSHTHSSNQIKKSFNFDITKLV